MNSMNINLIFTSCLQEIHAFVELRIGVCVESYRSAA